MNGFGEAGFGFNVLPRIRNFVIQRTNMAAQNVQAATHQLQTQPVVQTVIHFSPLGLAGRERQANRQQLRPMALIGGSAPAAPAPTGYIPPGY